MESPWCSSLNHSYETLNMPDSASDHDPSATTPLRNPHRPAPPVPAAPSNKEKTGNKSMTVTSEEADTIEVLDNESVNSSGSLYSSVSKRRKVKHPVSRRTLRLRKIHSLKRQIQIKEKMLEVRRQIIFHFSGDILSNLILFCCPLWPC